MYHVMPVCSNALESMASDAHSTSVDGPRGKTAGAVGVPIAWTGDTDVFSISKDDGTRWERVVKVEDDVTNLKG